MHHRRVALALGALFPALTLSLSMGALAQTESTTVTTPASTTHGSLTNGNLPKASGHNTLIDSGLPSIPQGNGSRVQLSTGTTTNGDLVKYDANGNAVDSGTLLGALAPLASPSFTGTVTLPDGSTWATGGLADIGTNAWAALNAFSGGLALPSPTNPTGSNFYVDSSGIFHFVSSHMDAPLIGACWLGDCSHAYFLSPTSFAATETSSGQKPPIACGRQEYYSGAGVFTYCQNNQYFHGKGVNTTTTAPFASGSTTLTVVANASIAAGQSVFGSCIPNGDTVSSYSAGSLVLTSGLSCNIPSGTTLGFPNASNSAPQNLATVGQFSLFEYSTESLVFGASTAINGYASRYSPSAMEIQGANFNAQDFTGRKSSIAGAILSAEFDGIASGPDDNLGRFGLDVVFAEQNPSIDGATDWDSGIRIRPAAANSHSPQPIVIDKGVNVTTMEGGGAAGMYGSFVHGFLCDGGESTGCYDVLSGSLTFNTLASALSGQANIKFALGTSINPGQIVSGSANIPAGATVSAVYQCDSVPTLTGCGSTTNATLVVLSAILTGTVGGATPLTFTGTFKDGSNFNGIFTDAFANWTSQQATGKIKCGTLLASGNVCDLQGFGEDSTSTTGTAYGDIIFGVTSNTHGSPVGFINLVPVGGGAAQFNGNIIATAASNLGFFSATTSAQLAGVLSDETGSGAAVFATSPTVATPALGAATATSINKVAFTAPTSSATLTIADGKTLTASNSVTLTATDGSTLGIGGGGTLGTFAFQSYATPPGIGGTTPAAGTFTTLAANSDFTSKAHVVSSGTALTSSNVSFGAGAGTSPTLNSITGDDHKFNINFTTGTTPSASAVIATVTFASAYGAAPQCIVGAAGANSALEIGRIFPTATTTTVVLNVNSSALGASTVLTLNVQCTQ